MGSLLSTAPNSTLTIMATVTGDSNNTTPPTCPTKDPVPYDRIILDLEDRPDIKKELEVATELLDYVLCRVPDPEDKKYKDDEDAYEDDLEEMQSKTDKIKPKSFPYTFYLMDDKQEKSYDDTVVPVDRAPVAAEDGIIIRLL